METPSPRPAPTSRPPGRRRLLAGTVLLALVLAVSACVAPPRAAPEGGGAAGPAGLWIGRAEVMALPTHGAAWTHLSQTARGGWGRPDLADNNATHDTSTLAGALVAVRTGDQALVQRTRSEIMAVTRITSYARVLELSRNITSYVVAADLVGLPSADDAAFRRFISGLRTRPLQGHSGGTDLTTTALRSANNWGTMARAAVTAIDLYLGDRAHLAAVADAHRAWVGENVRHQLRYSDTGWHTSTPPTGINRRGARIGSHDVGGVLPEEQRRTGEPSGRAAPQGSYPWEGMQGALVTGVLLHRAGIVPIGAGDGALARAALWLTHVNGNPAEGDDTWQPWVLNRVAGTRLATQPARSPGKNMGWSDWTHGPRA